MPVSLAAPDLLLIYNAKGGAFAALADALHKAISPRTYPCSLCAMTYGAVAMRGAWREFLGRLPNAKHFYHSDDFAAAFPALETALPAILIRHGDRDPEPLVTAAELDAVGDLEELMELVAARLGTLGRGV